MSKSTIEEALEKQRKLLQQKKASPVSQSVQQETDEVTKVESPKAHTKPVVPASPAPAFVANKASRSSLQIPLSKLEDEGYVSLCGTRKLVNEEFRGIKRKVLTNAFGPISATIDNSNLIMVTSASPSEGKSFSAINLALSIALEQDKTVLLVDCDVLKPSLHKKLHVPNDKGIMEYLSGDVDDVQEVINTTNVDKLRFISAGKKQ